MCSHAMFALSLSIQLDLICLFQKDLTLITTVLLAVLCGQRATEILTVIDICNIQFCPDELCIVRTDDLLKTCNIHFPKRELKFPANEKDKNICSVTCIKKYLEFTKPYAGLITKFFSTISCPFSPPSKDILGRLNKEALPCTCAFIDAVSFYSTL